LIEQNRQLHSRASPLGKEAISKRARQTQARLGKQK
jgi:hypothetical protein